MARGDVGPPPHAPVPVEESTPARLNLPQIRDAYSRLAPLFDLWEKFVDHRAKRLALQLASPRDGERILEVASGTGRVLEALAKANPNGLTAGIDLTPAMLERTQRRLRRASAHALLCQSDARALPFPDAGFDLIFCSYLLEMQAAPDIERTLREMRRLVRPGGRLALVHMRMGNRIFERAWNFVYWLTPTLLGGCRPVRLLPHLPAFGFAAVESRRVWQWGLPSEVILARRSEAKA